MTDFLASIEQSPLSIWVREDLYAYFYILIVHAIGMALLVGGGIVVSLRVAGLAAHAPLEKFRGFFPVMWLGLAFAIVSGVLLLAGYPAKALTNPVFALKFLFLGGAGFLVWLAARRLFPVATRGEPLPRWSRMLGLATLALWAAGVAAGKLLLYTYTMLTAS
jgi:hypothetical protein